MMSTISFFQAPKGWFAKLLTQQLGSWLPHTFGNYNLQYPTHTLIAMLIQYAGYFASFIAILTVSYMSFLWVLSASSSGSWLDPKSRSLYYLRIVIVLLLIFPWPAAESGSMPICSKLVADGAVIASNVADFTWSKIVDYIATPKIASPITNSVQIGEATLKNLVCAISVNATHSNMPFAEAVKNGSAVSNINQLDQLTNLDDVDQINWAGGSCGTTTFKTDNTNQADHFSQPYVKDLTQQSLQSSRRAYQGLIAALIPIAQKIHSIGGDALAEVMPGATSTDDSNYKALQDMGGNFATATSNYAKALSDIPNQISNSDVGETVKNEMKKEGWASAGLWFLELSKYHALLSSIISSFSVTSSAPKICSLSSWGVFQSTCIDKSYFADITKGISAVNNSAKTVLADTSKGIPSDFGQTNAKATSLCNTHSCNIKGISRTLSSKVSYFLMQTLTKFNDDQDQQDLTKGFVNPIWKLSALGHSYVNIATTIYGLKLSFIILKGATKGESQSWDGKALGAVTGGVFNAVASSLVAVMAELIKMLTIATAAIAANGYFLGYIVPFWPTLLWSFIVLVYLVIVLESMLAAPFVMAAALFPEGQGLNGLNMQRIFSLAAGILLRPFLYVCAFGIIYFVSYGAYELINMTFWNFVNLQGGGLFSVIANISVYTTICVTLVVWLFSLLPGIADSILTYLSVLVSKISAGNPIADIESRTRGVSQAFGQIADTSTTSQAMKEHRKNSENGN